MEMLRILPHNSDHHLGPLRAPISIVEYADYQCPYSAFLAPDIERLINELGTNLCYVHRHFPLKTIHPHTELAALASEAANRQHQFWSMHHLLYQYSAALSPGLIENLAIKLNLDMTLFKEDMGSYELKDKIRQQLQEGIDNGITSTPTLFINYRRYDGSSSYNSIKEVLNSLFDEGSVHLY